MTLPLSCVHPLLLKRINAFYSFSSYIHLLCVMAAPIHRASSAIATKHTHHVCKNCKWWTPSSSVQSINPNKTTAATPPHIHLYIPIGGGDTDAVGIENVYAISDDVVLGALLRIIKQWSSNKKTSRNNNRLRTSSTTSRRTISI